MQKMAKSHVFLSGMGGLGLEIGKQYFCLWFCWTDLSNTIRVI